MSQRYFDADVLQLLRTDPFQQKSGNKKAEEDANKDAEARLKEIDQAGKEKGKKVVDDLINAVVTPHPEVPTKESKED